jgi:predicted neuraminidase
MKKICLLLSAITILSLVSQVQGAEWLSIGKDRVGNELFYDREMQIMRSADIIKVWMKGIYSDEGRKERMQERIRSKATVERYEKLSYSLELQEINCAKKQFRILAYTDYASDEGILYKFISEQKPSEGWEFIARDSMGEQIYQTICPQRGSR